MSHQIILEIPDEVYEPLEQQARKAGKSAEAIINEWLERIVQLHHDPLRRWAGSFASGLPDVAEHHHEHLGRDSLPGREGLPNG